MIDRENPDIAINFFCLARLGDWIIEAIATGDTENLFDKIHADPRWLSFLRKVGKAPEQLAKIEFKATLPQ